MYSIKNKILLCPLCGKELAKVQINSCTEPVYVCADSSCRTFIKQDDVKHMDIDLYCKIQNKLNITKESKTYMLLKENLSGPLLVKNSNSALETNKNCYCIIKAESQEDALNQFKQKFKYIRVTEDMVVQINIKEV